jgi:hypothetical protein
MSDVETECRTQMLHWLMTLLSCRSLSHGVQYYFAEYVKLNSNFFWEILSSQVVTLAARQILVSAYIILNSLCHWP